MVSVVTCFAFFTCCCYCTNSMIKSQESDIFYMTKTLIYASHSPSIEFRAGVVLVHLDVLLTVIIIRIFSKCSSGVILQSFEQLESYINVSSGLCIDWECYLLLLVFCQLFSTWLLIFSLTWNSKLSYWQNTNALRCWRRLQSLWWIYTFVSQSLNWPSWSIFP